jgi:hypothetical protein
VDAAAALPLRRLVGALETGVPYARTDGLTIDV